MWSWVRRYKLINIMSFIFNKAYQRYHVITLLVTAAHAAIILFGLFSLDARSERGAQIMMMASLIDHPSSNASTKTSKLASKTSSSKVAKDLAPEKRSDPEEQGRQLESDEARSAPVTMPNPFAKGLDNPKPPYPLMSRRLNEEGKVVLNVCVSLSGLVEKLKLEKTSGYQRLDDIALETVKKWKFIPAKNQDRDINACYLLPVQFILRKDRAKLNG